MHLYFIRPRFIPNEAHYLSPLKYDHLRVDIQLGWKLLVLIRPDLVSWPFSRLSSFSVLPPLIPVTTFIPVFLFSGRSCIVPWHFWVPLSFFFPFISHVLGFRAKHLVVIESIRVLFFKIHVIIVLVLGPREIRLGLRFFVALRSVRLCFFNHLFFLVLVVVLVQPGRFLYYQSLTHSCRPFRFLLIS